MPTGPDATPAETKGVLSEVRGLLIELKAAGLSCNCSLTAGISFTRTWV